MALINCKECGAQISDISEYCVTCGAPTTYSLSSIDDEVDRTIKESNQPESVMADELNTDTQIQNKKDQNNEKTIDDKKIEIIGITITCILMLAIIFVPMLSSLSKEEILAAGALQLLINELDSTETFYVHEIEIAKNNELNSEFADYIVKITYNNFKDEIGIRDPDTGHSFVYVGITMGEPIQYILNRNLNAMYMIGFPLFEEHVIVNTDKIIKNLYEYDFSSLKKI